MASQKNNPHCLYKLRDRSQRMADIGLAVLLFVFPAYLICLAVTLAIYFKQPQPPHSIIELPGEVITIKTNRV